MIKRWGVTGCVVTDYIESGMDLFFVKIRKTVIAKINGFKLIISIMLSVTRWIQLPKVRFHSWPQSIRAC